MFGLITAIVALAAPADASPAPPPAAGWQSDWSSDKCSLILHFGDPAKDTFLKIHIMPGEDDVFVTLINTRWHHSPARDPREVTLSLEPGGAQATASASYSEISFDREPGPSFSLRIADRTFLGRLASAEALAVTEGDRTIAHFSLPLADKAVATLRACEDDLLRRWNIDPVFWNGLHSGPVPIRTLASYVSDADFPSNARGASGKSVVKLTVDATGRPIDCTVLGSAGNAALDRATCRIFVSRPRFQPALGPDGKPVSAPYVATMRWFAGRI